MKRFKGYLEDLDTAYSESIIHTPLFWIIWTSGNGICSAYYICEHIHIDSCVSRTRRTRRGFRKDVIRKSHSSISFEILPCNLRTSYFAICSSPRDFIRIKNFKRIRVRNGKIRVNFDKNNPVYLIKILFLVKNNNLWGCKRDRTKMLNLVRLNLLIICFE